MRCFIGEHYHHNKEAMITYFAYSAMNDVVANRYASEFLALCIRIVCSLVFIRPGGLEFRVHTGRFK